MTTRKEELQNKITAGFFGWWIRKYRISYLITAVLVLLGLSAIIQIPKESSPNVDLGIVSITTVYPGANPEDIDGLITQKIYKQVENISGIDKIQSTSSLGLSNIFVTLKTNADSQDILSDIRNKVGTLRLPTDAKSPIITNIKSDTSRLFSLYLYDKNENVSRANLVERAMVLKKELEILPAIKDVTFAAIDKNGDQSTYETEIIISNEKLSTFGLSLANIADDIKNYNRNIPIGNFEVGGKNYDYRINGKYTNISDFLQTPIGLPNGNYITLNEIATAKRKYEDNSNIAILAKNGEFRTAIGLTISKKESASIFASSESAKAKIDELFTTKLFENYGFKYTYDIAKKIGDDYKDLFENAIATLVLVFIAMFLFVGFFDSLFATITLPLAFLATFIILNSFGYSMNFLTNFSLILSFGIAIDTIIVLVQVANAKLRLGYDPKTAISLAIREYSIPLIAGVSTTIVVFIPMMVLPGIIGKFLSYIPITIFGVLASGLILALTVNTALYLAMVKKKKTYQENEELTSFLSREDKELLMFEREGKTQIQQTETPLRLKILAKIIKGYKCVLSKILRNTFLRRLFIIFPIAFFIFGLFFIAPSVGFEMFPKDDNNQFSITIHGGVGMTTEKMAEKIGDLSSIFQNFKEFDAVSIITKNSNTRINIDLTDYKKRKNNGEKNVFELENIISSRLAYLKGEGFSIESTIPTMGPPKKGGTIGIDLIAENTKQLGDLIRVSKDFEDYIKSLPNTKNTDVSIQDTPGQFVLRLKKDLLAQKGINPAMLYGRILQEINGITVGSIEDNGKDMDVVLKNSNFDTNITPDSIANIALPFGKNTYEIGDFLDINTQNSVAQINRKNGDITINVGADTTEKGDNIALTKSIKQFAQEYKFPNGISYSLGGENNENADLFIGIITAFLVAIVAIFGILTLQFNNFSQPILIFYSVFMALPFVVIGLLLTRNPFSLMFAIGFIAFTGIALNHGIILIDAINANVEKGMPHFDALIEGGASRFEPMILTTVTTILGLLPIALQNRFWGGMGFTIMFGLFATTLITLFVLKGLYYEVYMKKHHFGWKKKLKKS